MTDPFRDPRCQCASTPDLLRAEIGGVDVALCPVHQQDEIRTRDASKERDDAARRAARTEVIYEELRNPPTEPAPSCTCDAKRDISAALMGEEIAPCPQHRPSPPATGPAIGLNDEQLVAMTGIPVAPSEHDQPLDAA